MPAGTVTLRQTSAQAGLSGTSVVCKGSALSHDELDSNFLFLQSGTGASAETVQGVLRYMGKSIVSFGASTSGTAAANTTAIQAAHDAAKNDVFQCVLWPAGTYSMNAITISPYVRHIALGRVVIQTALASGSLISISDQYGNGSSITANGLTRTKCFDGPFFIQNTNGANTARAFFIGGATNANYATQLEIECSVFSFNGGVVQYGYNAWGVWFVNSFWYNNLTGGLISALAGATNMGENFGFRNCVFGGATGGGAGPLFDWNIANACDFTFLGCSADYLSGLNKTGNSAPLTKVCWLGGHLEWNTTTAPYLSNDGGMEWNIDGPFVTGPVVAYNNPYITDTSGTSTTRFIHAKYATPAGINTFHRLNSANAVGVFDYTPNYQGASGPTTFVNKANASATLNYADPTWQTGTWTPVITFSTPGDLAVSYLVQSGQYRRIGDEVTVSFWVESTSFTYTTSAGNLRVSGLPFTNGANVIEGAAGRTRGWTKANYTDISLIVQNANTVIDFGASGSGQSPVTLSPTEVASGGTVSLRGSVTYFMT